MGQTQKEKEAAARKRSEASKKAAATRKANAEAAEKQAEEQGSNGQEPPQEEPQSTPGDSPVEPTQPQYEEPQVDPSQGDQSDDEDEEVQTGGFKYKGRSSVRTGGRRIGKSQSTVRTGGRRLGKKAPRSLSVNDVVELENHRADVKPDDQAVQHDQRQGELDAEREIHNLRTGGRKWRELVGNAVGRMRW